MFHVRTFCSSALTTTRHPVAVPHRGERLRRRCGRSPRRSCRPTSCTATGEIVSREEAVSRGRASRSARIVERHPNSTWRPRARFLIGEAFYRESGVRQGRQGVRHLPRLLSASPDRRPRAVPAGHELLRPDQADRAGSGARPPRHSISSGSSSRNTPTAATPPTRWPRSTSAAARLAQKEVWVATYYFNQGNPSARPSASGVRAEGVPAHAGDPETLCHRWPRSTSPRARARKAVSCCRQLASITRATPSGDAARAQRLRTMR